MDGLKDNSEFHFYKDTLKGNRELHQSGQTTDDCKKSLITLSSNL